MTERLFEYLPNATAFIYVLNSANSGGVQNDKVRETNLHLFHSSVNKNLWKFFGPSFSVQIVEVILICVSGLHTLKNTFLSSSKSVLIYKLVQIYINP